VNEDYNHYLIAKGKHKMRYAKIYWHTKNCLLQKYCFTDGTYPKQEYNPLKNEWNSRGFTDVRFSNIGRMNGKLYAFDVLKKIKSMEKQNGI